MNLVGRIDLLASTGVTPWHRASAIAKLALAAALVTLAIVAPSLRLVLALHAVAWVLALTSRIPWPLLLAAAGYPLVAISLFVLVSWDGTWSTLLRWGLRPLTASLVAAWLVTTTPYPDLFAPLSRILPRGVGDGLFITYRALFDLLGRAERLWRAMRLRGGTQLPWRDRVTLVGEGLGALVLHGFDRSHRLYATLLLRGHSGRICGCRHYAEVGRADLVVAFAGLVVLGASVWLWRAP